MESSSKAKKNAATEKSIETAFLAIYAEKPFEQITIKGITEDLKINRGTFYLHYFDLDHLLTSIEDRHLQAIRKLNEQNRHHYLSTNLNELLEFFIPTLEYIETNKQVIRILMGQNSRPRFTDTFKSIMRSNIEYKGEQPIGNYKWKEYKQYIIEILVTGNIGIITNWINSEEDITIQDIAKSFGDILMSLPYTNLHT
jgi:AcrR family transcriptional regulator